MRLRLRFAWNRFCCRRARFWVKSINLGGSLFGNPKDVLFEIKQLENLYKVEN